MNKVKVIFDEPTTISLICGCKNIRHAWLIIKGLTKVGWSDKKIFAGTIVGKTPFEEELLYPAKKTMQMLKECFVKELSKPQRTGIKGYRGYFKILGWEEFSF